ncbi:MAG: hypothetical protein PHF51_05565, partial [Candidatus ainarchaeum sp.]|nr:hypothetical protein [Candidatus ainarchaeum sp.]
DDYSTYANWYVAQITMTEKIALADLVKIVDVATKLAPDGTSANVRASVLYVGVDPINVTMLLETPEGFEPDPKMITSTLIPRGVDHAEFRVAVPPTLPPNTTETHIMRFVVAGDAFIVDLESPLVVKKPAAATQSAPTSPPSMDQIVIIALISSLVSSVVVTIMLFVYGKMGGWGKQGYGQERPKHVEHVGKHDKQQVGD